jgi:hypothetical protein
MPNSFTGNTNIFSNNQKPPMRFPHAFDIDETNTVNFKPVSQECIEINTQDNKNMIEIDSDDSSIEPEPKINNE